MLVIGSRGSKLALWQANHIQGHLERLGHECRIEVITTTGDRFQSGPLKEVGNKGLFTKEIEEALLDGRVDLAVHSLKDMPNELPDGLKIVATPPREDVRDAIIGHKLDELPQGARVGTGSLRRMAQLKALRSDLHVEGIRGNVDTRLRKLDEGQFDSIVLAAAGLNRLGWADRIAELLPVEVMCPAAGQGCLAIETRDDGGPGMQACLELDDAATHACIDAERAVLSVLGGGCHVPIGVHATNDGKLHVRGVVIAPDGSRIVKQEIEGSDPVATGRELGMRLLDNGAREILA